MAHKVGSVLSWGVQSSRPATERGEQPWRSNNSKGSPLSCTSIFSHFFTLAAFLSQMLPQPSTHIHTFATSARERTKNHHPNSIQRVQQPHVCRLIEHTKQMEVRDKKGQMEVNKTIACVVVMATVMTTMRTWKRCREYHGRLDDRLDSSWMWARSIFARQAVRSAYRNIWSVSGSLRRSLVYCLGACALVVCACSQ